MADDGEEEPPPAIDENGSGSVSSKMPMPIRRRRLELRRLKSEGCSCSAGKRTKTHVGVESSGNSSSSSMSTASCSSGDEGREASADGTPRLSHGVVSLMGRRREMEDAVTVAPGFASAEAGEGGAAVVPSAGSKAYDFFGVYDGHGGRKVAEACGERLHVAVAEEVAGGRAEGRWREAMVASFARVDGELAGFDKWSEERTVGSTAVVAVVGPRQIVVANCGDSRAVLSRGGVAVPLSFDHKPDRPDELERVEAAGGRVIDWDGYRILGVLATSRSIGDYYLKPFVTSEPEVTVSDRTEKDEFLILASDGLWDVVSNEAACHIVRQCLNGQLARMFPDAVNGRNAADAAAILAELAMSRGSKDNITVVVVQLKQLGS